MDLKYERDLGILHLGDRAFPVVCKVRNEQNGLRKRSEKVVRTENFDGSSGVPYMPRPFPLGRWKITGIFPKSDPYEAPEFIATDAHQPVDEWSEVSGHYGERTGRRVEDFGYGFHNSTSSTTLGCGRVLYSADRAELSEAIREAWARGEEVHVDVV